jgi:Dyp-type peroxidase family
MIRSRLTQATRPDIQGFILSGYGHMPHSAFLLLRVDDARAARSWIARVTPRLQTAAPWKSADGEKPKTAMNLAFTWAGLSALGLARDTLQSFPHEFAYGMAERALILQDTGTSAPEHWELGAPAAPIHVMLLLYATDVERLETLVESERGDLSAGLAEVGLERGDRPRTNTEQFGFRDGVSQPPIGSLREGTAPKQFIVEAGAFVLGHTDEYGVLPPTPSVTDAHDPDGVLPPFPGYPGRRDLGRNGTYFVYRKLEQDVAGFWNFAEQQANGDPAEMVAIASKFIGRWPSGAPLALFPDRDSITPGRRPRNGFGYLEEDPHGYGCPIGSHVRRVNPRDSLSQLPRDAATKTTMRHRILRRGISYGKPAFSHKDLRDGKPPVGLAPDEEPRGLHFIGINTSLSSQFEMVSEEWAMNARFQGLFQTQDPVLGNDAGPGRMVIQRNGVRRVIEGVPSFVTTKGGDYFFMPGVTALHFLGAAPRDAARGQL